MDLESRGIPAGFVASSEFIEAAEAQGNSLAFTLKAYSFRILFRTGQMTK